jgi:hypothetical protein
MEFRRAWLIAVATCVAAPAFAQESAPVQPAKAAAPVPATPAVPTSATAEPKASDSAAPASDAKTSAASVSPASPLEGELDAEKIMAAQRAGYKIQNQNGQQLLCRRDLQTGSRLRYITSCLTAREWTQLQEENRLQLKSMQRTPMKVEGR